EDIHLTINTFSANLDTVAKQLIQLANDNGGRDNVSVVMAHIVDAFPARTKMFDSILGWFGCFAIKNNEQGKVGLESRRLGDDLITNYIRAEYNRLAQILHKPLQQQSRYILY